MNSEFKLSQSLKDDNKDVLGKLDDKIDELKKQQTGIFEEKGTVKEEFYKIKYEYEC
jgi:hypothetical protein